MDPEAGFPVSLCERNPSLSGCPGVTVLSRLCSPLHCERLLGSASVLAAFRFTSRVPVSEVLDARVTGSRGGCSVCVAHGPSVHARVHRGPAAS